MAGGSDIAIFSSERADDAKSAPAEPVALEPVVEPIERPELLLVLRIFFVLAALSIVAMVIQNRRDIAFEAFAVETRGNVSAKWISYPRKLACEAFHSRDYPSDRFERVFAEKSVFDGARLYYGHRRQCGAYRVRVSFQTTNGQLLSRTKSLTRRQWRAIVTGGQVPVWYLPGDPSQNSVIDTATRHVTHFYGIAALALFFLGCCGTVAYFRPGSRPRKSLPRPKPFSRKLQEYRPLLATRLKPRALLARRQPTT